jgi:hypothetical protein
MTIIYIVVGVNFMLLLIHSLHAERVCIDCIVIEP